MNIRSLPILRAVAQSVKAGAVRARAKTTSLLCSCTPVLVAIFKETAVEFTATLLVLLILHLMGLPR